MTLDEVRYDSHTVAHRMSYCITLIKYDYVQIDEAILTIDLLTLKSS